MKNLSTFILGLFLARKAIASKFMAAIFTPLILPALTKFYAFVIGSTLAKAAVAFLKFNPIGLIIGILLSFFTLFGEKIYDYFNRKGLSGFVADIMTVLFDLVKGAIKGIGSLLGFGGGAAGGIGSFFSGLSGGSKLGLGLGALALAGGLGRRRWESFEHHDQSKLSGQANRSTKPSHRNYTRRIYRCPCCRLMDRTRKLLKIQS